MSEHAIETPHAIDTPLAIETQLTARGYRSVLLHLAALRLRFAPLALGMAGMLSYGAGYRTEALGLFGALIAIPIVLWGYLSWLTSAPSSRPLYVPVRYTFTAEGILYESAEGDGELAWEDLTRWREATGHVLLYLSGSRYLVIPVEQLAEEDRTRLEGLLGEKLGKPRGKRSSLR